VLRIRLKFARKGVSNLRFVQVYCGCGRDVHMLNSSSSPTMMRCAPVTPRSERQICIRSCVRILKCMQCLRIGSSDRRIVSSIDPSNIYMYCYRGLNIILVRRWRCTTWGRYDSQHAWYPACYLLNWTNALGLLSCSSDNSISLFLLPIYVLTTVTGGSSIINGLLK
jgi:hypothetical protein